MKKENRDNLKNKATEHVKAKIVPQVHPRDREIREALNKAQKDNEKK